MPDRMPENMPDRMPEDMSEYMPEDMPDRMPDRMPEDMPDRMPNRMSENMSNRMPQDVPVRTCINVMVGITRSKVFFKCLLIYLFICLCLCIYLSVCLFHVQTKSIGIETQHKPIKPRQIMQEHQATSATTEKKEETLILKPATKHYGKQLPQP